MIEYIPVSVTLGLPQEVGITIGTTMQIKDFLGLQVTLAEHCAESRRAVYGVAHRQYWRCRHCGVVTLGTLIFWPRLGIRLPGHLPALLAGLRRDGDR